MPNWCFNRLIVDGDAAEVDRFIEATGGPVEMDGKTVESPLSMNALVPVPATVPDVHIVDWRLSNWGTKWDVPHVLSVDQVPDDHVQYEFDTANNPPIAWLKAVARQFPTLIFELVYEESGCDFTGRVGLQGTAVLHEMKSTCWQDADEADEGAPKVGYVTAPEGPSC